ncbi:DUF6160 family protein [Ideonella sp. BN130291]|uniref:DUF6160 family protein n=1 Tax=Ideonella sp. BN130291 TaxID=3112940 RepID=UPI002E26A6E7|nr:DUF6160 family protein [Ideonella sp. BN130291]
MHAVALLLALLCCTLRAVAAPEALDDDALAEVHGQDGVSLFLHLELDTSLNLGFKVDGRTTFAVLQGVGGTADLFGLTLDIGRRPDGLGTFIDVGLPAWVGFKDFGFRALGAQADPQTPITPATSYGQLLINGTANLTGHVYLWAAP